MEHYPCRGSDTLFLVVVVRTFFPEHVTDQYKTEILVFDVL